MTHSALKQDLDGYFRPIINYLFSPLQQSALWSTSVEGLANTSTAVHALRKTPVFTSLSLVSGNKHTGRTHFTVQHIPCEQHSAHDVCSVTSCAAG